MFIVRPVNMNDVEACERFALTSSLGITSLPKNRDSLERKIQRSINSFSKDVEYPKNELYLFVLEDTIRNLVVGISGIEACLGSEKPAFFYRIETDTLNGRPIALPKEVKSLHPVKYSNGPSEMCTLYLLPEFRKGGLGLCISLSRFLFMANYLKRFQETIVAVMRAVITRDEVSPFWEAIGRKLMDVSYSEFVNLMQDDGNWIHQTVSKYPIYVSMLPEKARAIIGKTHEKTTPALKLLRNQGFNFTDEVDAFDGGPKLVAITKDISTVRESQTATIHAYLPAGEGSQYLLSNTTPNFRACYSNLDEVESGCIRITQEACEGLNLKIGDTIRYIKTQKKGK